MRTTVVLLALVGCQLTSIPEEPVRTGPTTYEILVLRDAEDLDVGTIMMPGDHDGDGFTTPTDCDDTFAAINPVATEICDGVDNNCDGNIDEGSVCAGCDTTALAGYAFCSSSDDWLGARSACTSMGYDLVSIGSALEDTNVIGAGDTVIPNASWWIGFNDRATEGSFGWSDGSPVVYTNWAGGEPNDAGGNEDCTQNGWGGPNAWNDNNCTMALPYICETCATTGWYTDADGDGYGDPASVVFACVQPPGTTADFADCDDGDAAINPMALETCDGVDNDCDTATDEGMASWFRDVDMDGYGDVNDSVTTASCPSSAPTGYVNDARDCDDLVFATNPSGTEICDGVDNDCDGDADEAPGSCTGACTADVVDGASYLFCDMGTSWTAARNDCRSYGAYDLVSIGGLAQNDAVTAYADAIDPGSWWMGFNDRATEGTFVWSDGSATAFTQWGAGEPNNSGGNEDCGVLNVNNAYDWNDRNCVANLPYVCGQCTAVAWYADTDGDGYGDPLDAVYSCDAVPGRVADRNDCDDSISTVNPGATEVCNGIDDDCDGIPDEDAIWHRDLDGDGYGDPADTTTTADCSMAPPGYVGNLDDCDDVVFATNPAAMEICNGFDDNCDGTADEGGVCSGSGCTTVVDGASSYLLCNLPRGLAAAETYCDAYGYDLYAINDADEEAMIAPLSNALRNAPWWFGLNDRSIEGTFVYTNGDPVTYTNWGGGEPNDYGSGEDCATFATSGAYLWNDLRCTASRAFVCETCANQAWFADLDGDGFGDPTNVLYACVQPEGYLADHTDCDDTNNLIFPGAVEQCNGVDDDCDTVLDNDPVVFRDVDLDAYGDPNDTLPTVCGAPIPVGYVGAPGDCDDTDMLVNPGAAEVCNAIDDNCDADVDEGNVCAGCTTHTYAGTTYQFCSPGSNWVGAQSTCRGWGYDLTSLEDSAENEFVRSTALSISTSSWWIGANDRTTEGSFEWSNGDVFGYTNWSSGEPNNYGGNEDCTELRTGTGQWNDLNCASGRRYVCEVGCVEQLYYTDVDGDGFGDASAPVLACVVTPGIVADSSDCDDTEAGINPLVTDTPGNGVDDNCDGVDDCYLDTDGDSYGTGTVVPGNDLDCTDPAEASVLGDCDDADGSIHPGATEAIADGIDQDCDLVDQCYVDADGDGVGVTTTLAGDDLDCDNTVGESSRDGDCDDSDTFNAPGNVEVPANGLDEDCSGADEWFVASDFNTGDVVISEILSTPSTMNGEWFEIYNAFGIEVSLSGMVVENNAGDSFVVDTLVIPQFGYAVFAKAGAIQPGVIDVLLPDDFDITPGTGEIVLAFDGVGPRIELDTLLLDASFPASVADEMISLHPPFFDALDNDTGANWCIDGVGTPGAANVDCGVGNNPLLEDPTPRSTFVEFDYSWAPGVGAPFGASTDITLTVSDPFDPSGVVAPDPVVGRFSTGNSGDGDWWAWHNEQGNILVWRYDSTNVIYRGVSDANGCYTGIMRIDQDYVGTWVETNCP